MYTVKSINNPVNDKLINPCRSLIFRGLQFRGMCRYIKYLPNALKEFDLSDIIYPADPLLYQVVE